MQVPERRLGWAYARTSVVQHEVTLLQHSATAAAAVASKAVARTPHIDQDQYANTAQLAHLLHQRILRLDHSAHLRQHNGRQAQAVNVRPGGRARHSGRATAAAFLAGWPAAHAQASASQSLSSQEACSRKGDHREHPPPSCWSPAAPPPAAAHPG